MIIRNIKDTKADRRYFDERGRIAEAARAGKLGKSMLTLDPKTGEWHANPKKTFRRV